MTKQELFGTKIEPLDDFVYNKAKANFDALAKPLDGFGDLEDIICRIAAIQGSENPDISKKAAVVVFSDNGVVKSGVSQTDSSVTLDVARLFAKGVSTVGVETEGFGIDMIGVDVGVDSDEKIPGIIDRKVRRGTGDIAEAAAMTEDDCLAAIKAGIDVMRDCKDKGYGLIATGEMGIGNTTTATALLCALTGADPGEVTGRGAGLSDEGLKRKITVIKQALSLHGLNAFDKGDTKNPGQGPGYALSSLSSVGGLDIAALAGIFIGGAIYHIPVIIDGLIGAVAALTAYHMLPGAQKYMIASHRGRERGCDIALSRMGLKAVIDANMALGEGTGAVMIIPVIEMVINVYNHGTSFKTAQIQQYGRYE